MQEFKSGMIVKYSPGTDPEKQLPNGMESAPAIITQVFGEQPDASVGPLSGVSHANMVVFVADSCGNPVRQEFSVMNVNHPAFSGNENLHHFSN